MRNIMWLTVFFLVIYLLSMGFMVFILRQNTWNYERIISDMKEEYSKNISALNKRIDSAAYTVVKPGDPDLQDNSERTVKDIRQLQVEHATGLDESLLLDTGIAADEKHMQKLSMMKQQITYTKNIKVPDNYEIDSMREKTGTPWDKAGDRQESINSWHKLPSTSK